MADQGLLGQSKPAATTNTLLYAAPYNSSASTALTIANDGTGASSYDLAIKTFDQRLTVDGTADEYLLHPGDVVTSYRFGLGTAISIDAGLTPGTQLTSVDGEKTAYFESFYIPTFTTILVQAVDIRILTLESVTGTIAVGETVRNGDASNNATATVYSVTQNESDSTATVYIGPSSLNGTGVEFAAADTVVFSGSATGTVDANGPTNPDDVGSATPSPEFVFSDNGGTSYNLYNLDSLTLLGDRTYRFDVSHSSMSGRDFKLSETENGEYGPDGDFTAVDDNGTEYTVGKTTGAGYVQYDFSANSNLPDNLYFYDGQTGTAANSNYGGSDRLIFTSSSYVYDEIYIYDKVGTWTNAVDSFTFAGVTYALTTQTAGPYGYVRSYSGNTVEMIKGINSADFAGTDTFQDAPLSTNVARSTVVVNSVGLAATALEGQHYLAKDKAIAANAVERITSLVIGPGERLYVESNDAYNSFNLLGFEDASTAFTTNVYNPSADAGGSGGGGA